MKDREKSCPKCKCVGLVSEVFGWRGTAAQSWCFECRKADAKDRRRVKVEAPAAVAPVAAAPVVIAPAPAVVVPMPKRKRTQDTAHVQLSLFAC